MKGCKIMHQNSRPRSRVRYDNPTADIVPDEHITHIRLYKDHGEWFLDGVDDAGNYSSCCWSYDTFEDAVSDLPSFRTTFDLD